MVVYLLLPVAFIGGFILSVYPKYAPKRGWRVWRSLRDLGGGVASLGFASMAGAAVFLVLRAEWWQTLVLLVVGIAIAVMLMRMLKSTVQSVAVALIVFSWLWFVLTEVRW